jgi:hypothetical protein
MVHSAATMPNIDDLQGIWYRAGITLRLKGTLHRHCRNSEKILNATPLPKIKNGAREESSPLRIIALS